jgi:hypothetical protein
MKVRTDINIPQKEWNSYLKKYEKEYKVFKDEIGIWSIKCKHGFIQPHSMIDKELAAILNFKSQRGINLLKSACLSQQLQTSRITQEGDQDIVIVFNEKEIKTASCVFGCSKKKKLNEGLRKYNEMIKNNPIEYKKRIERLKTGRNNLKSP